MKTGIIFPEFSIWGIVDSSMKISVLGIVQSDTLPIKATDSDFRH